MGDERKRVAILGGGAAGLTAALELTDPALKGRYEVTVYQLGWRLGGKGASGRRRHGAERIEEHGLHIWFGFYDNAFDVMQRVYAELDRPPGTPLATWREAFEPCNDIVLFNEVGGQWARRRWHFPPNDGVPGLPSEERSFRDVVGRAVNWLHQALRGSEDNVLPMGFTAALDTLVRICEAGADAFNELADGFDEAREAVGRFVDWLQGDDEGPAEEHDGPSGAEQALVASLERLRDMIWLATEAHSLVPGSLRDYAMAFDLCSTMLRGILADGLVRKGFGEINDEELCEWLTRHEIREQTLAESPMLRSFYQLCFAYAEGDRERPSVAAGKAVQAIIRIACTYEGSIMWKMQAGMGDAIFAPLYEALRARGVRFAFFHQVTRLGLDPTRAFVAEIDVVEQARVRDGAGYEPLFADPGGLRCWPSEPLWEQLAGGDALRARGTNFEREAEPPGAKRRTLRRGGGKDFDEVVLAIPVGALAPLCAELAGHSAPFAMMLSAASTVGTQALQVWLRADSAQLGWFRQDTVSGAFATPLDTYADMTHLLARENWPAKDDVRHVAYFCGVMADRPGETADEADERARADGLAHLSRHCGPMWPDVTDGDSLRWDVLVDEGTATGEARFEAQYWRASIGAHERYVLTPPGSVDKRLRAGESGFCNLYLAGDWTRNGICGGSVEAAVTSGRMAAQALSDFPLQIPGLDGWLESD